MAAIAFIVGFLVIGLAVFFVAFRGGRGRQPESPAERRRRIPRGVLGTIAAVFIAFGVAIPAWALVYNAEGQADRARGGVQLTAAQQRGRDLFRRNCATCHTLADAGAVGRVGPNLDQLQPPPGLTLNAIMQGRARGQGQMPALLLTGNDARDVANYIAAVAGR